MRHHQHKPSSTSSSSSTPPTPHLPPPPFTKKPRGSYNCGRCGVPKKGHKCHLPPPFTPPPPPPRPAPQRVLLFDDTLPPSSPLLDEYTELSPTPLEHPEEGESENDGFDPDEEIIGGGGMSVGGLWEVFKRLPPTGVMSASGVCKGWRDLADTFWNLAEEIRIRVPVKGSVSFLGCLVKKCPSLVRISLTMESDLDATMLACIAFSCPNLESMEITMLGSSINRITGDELGRFVSDRRCLSSFKMDQCSSLGSLVISSSSLSTLWLSDLHSLSKTVFNCPNLKEVSLNFSHKETDSTDLTIMMDNLGKSCPKLQNIHVASTRLCHATVLALASANLRGLKMLSLLLGSGITDASVAAIACSFSKLELLDLSGSSITDSGIATICNVFSRSLSRLLLAVCPNITSSGIQFATAQLPLLELMDCGMTICDGSDDVAFNESDDSEPQKFNNKSLHIYQKLIIKHNRLKKLSLWGCSGLDALCLSCPELSDLNLTSCRNLHPERLLLQCPNLESVHASECIEALRRVVDNQVNNCSIESHLLTKRMADGSKRVRVPHMLSHLYPEDTKDCPVAKRRCTVYAG